MRPYTHDLPAFRAQTHICVKVPLSICDDFLAPEFRVCLWPSCMQRAAVPKAAIYKHRNTKSGEHDIGNATWLIYNPDVDTITKAASVQLTAQCDLGRCVFLPNSPHSKANVRPGGLNPCAHHHASPRFASSTAGICSEISDPLLQLRFDYAVGHAGQWFCR